MKLVNRPLGEAADVSSARNSAMPELRTLLILTTLLAVGIYLVIGVVVDLIVMQIPPEKEAELFGGMTFGHYASENSSTGDLARADLINTPIIGCRLLERANTVSGSFLVLA